MNIDTSTSTSGDRDANDQRQTELTELRRKLANKYEYVREEGEIELYEDIDEFLQATASLHDGSIAARIKSKIRELKRGNKMRDHRGVEDPEDAFPDDCEECDHYGVQCPIVKRYSVTKTIERVLEEAESDEEVLEKITDIAIENDCDVLLDELEDCQDSYADRLEEGYKLNSRATVVLSSQSVAGDVDEHGVDLDAGPSPEGQQRMNETIDAVMSDEEAESE
jgi:hypothetical protein